MTEGTMEGEDDSLVGVGDVPFIDANNGAVVGT